MALAVRYEYCIPRLPDQFGSESPRRCFGRPPAHAVSPVVSLREPGLLERYIGRVALGVHTPELDQTYTNMPTVLISGANRG